MKWYSSSKATPSATHLTRCSNGLRPNPVFSSRESYGLCIFILFDGQVPLFYLVDSNSPCSSLSILARRSGFVFAQLEQLPRALEDGAFPVLLLLTLQLQARTDVCRGDHQMSLGDWECRTWFGLGWKEEEGIGEAD